MVGLRRSRTGEMRRELLELIEDDDEGLATTVAIQSDCFGCLNR